VDVVQEDIESQSIITVEVTKGDGANPSVSSNNMNDIFF